jgi:hypothetical protein
MRAWIVALFLGGCFVQPAPGPRYGGQPGYGQPGGPPPGYGQPPTSSEPGHGQRCGTGNLALGKMARQSSTSSWSTASDAQGAIESR